MKFLEDIGGYVLLLKNAIAKPEKFSMYAKETMRQMYDIGVGSLIIVAIISAFIGAVAAIQFSYQLTGGFIPMYYVGYIVRDTMIIELSPTITCLVLAGKVGSNMAAEIGGMRQKEQIDALEIMGVNTAGYLIMPKVIAAMCVIPLLVILSAFLGIIGGYFAAISTGHVTGGQYEEGLRAFYNSYFVFMMVVKSIVFSFILTTVSCYQGYNVKGGSIGLGKASTQAVVLSDILILVSDYVVAMILT
jgi:phospholipid/cholesterol/gamma-HCH transport system permease protein